MWCAYTCTFGHPGMLLTSLCVGVCLGNVERVGTNLLKKKAQTTENVKNPFPLYTHSDT